MRRGDRWRRATFAAILAVASCRPADAIRTSPARARAEQLAADAEADVANLRLAAMVPKVMAAVRADPSFVPPVAILLREADAAYAAIAVAIDSLASEAADPGLAFCYSAIGAVHRGTRPGRTRPTTLTRDARLCLDFVAVISDRGALRVSASTADEIIAAFPGAPEPVLYRLAQIARDGNPAALAAAARRYLLPATPPAVRAVAYGSLTAALYAQSQDAEARATERAALADPAMRRPAYRVLLADQFSGFIANVVLHNRRDAVPLARHADSLRGVADDLIQMAARDAGDAVGRFRVELELAVSRLDRGQIESAVRDLRVLARTADSIGDPGSRAYTAMRYGRALVKAGRAADAERVLLAARAPAAVAAMPSIQKEIEHNLLHLYESLGRHADARVAGDAFVRYAGMGALDPVAMMSVRDMGMFLRARGNVAQSMPYFERMLADVDSLDTEWYFAGEYREIVGDVDGARQFYEREIDRGGQQVLAMEGLIRSSLALGDTAAARRWADVHDAARDVAGRPESYPLLPLVLARSAGREAPVAAAFDAARGTVRAAGQIASWATLTADFAAFEADAGRRARAVALADSAAWAARGVGAAEVALRARALAAYGRALGADGVNGNANAGPRVRALATLASLAAEGRRTAGPQLRAELFRLQGAALAAVGAWMDALAAYRRAAEPLDSVAAGIAMTTDQAAYRSAQRRVYNAALSLIAAHASDARAIAAFAEWSTRRKGRAFGGVPPVSQATALPAGSAIVDFVVLDSIVAALVRTATVTTLVTLDARPADVANAIRRLRSGVDARVGSAIDLAHARFPLDAAHQLYEFLLRPLERNLRGATTLVVIPDGMLSLVPFDALVSALPADGVDEQRATFVLDRFTVVVATSLGAPAAPMRMPAGPWVAVAPTSAPGADRELDAIANAVPRASITTLRGNAATRAGVLARAKDAAVLHFIAHAEANELDPGSSRLDLEPGPADNGHWRAADIAALRINASLVVLSACETAGGAALSGEGVLSLSRAFLQAGAHATIATLWPIGGAAADFAGAFYSAAKQGDLARAAHDAKRAMRAGGAPAFAWAPFQMVVGPRAVTNRSVAR